MKLNKISVSLPWLTLDYKMSGVKFFVLLSQAGNPLGFTLGYKGG